jgi:putative salt-induced outer membrane protein YdiY
MDRRIIIQAGAALLVLAASAVAQEAAPELDTIKLANGDTITGTVKSAKGGKMTVATGYAAAIKIDIGKIESITTAGELTLKLDSGDRVKGRLRMVEKGVLEVILGPSGDTARIGWSRVKEINPGPDVVYKGFVALGGSTQSGNTDRKSFSLSAQMDRITEIDRFSLRFLWNYSEEDEIRTARNVFGAVKYDYRFSDRIYGYLSLDLLYDEFRDIDLRMVASVGVGWDVVREDHLTLQAEAGVAYVSENFDTAPDDDHFALRAAGKLVWKISDAFSVRDQVVYLPSMEENQYILRNEFAVTSALGSGWSLNLSNVFDFQSDPPAGVDRSDTIWMLSLQYTFG